MVPGYVLKVPEIFHHWSARRIAGMTARRTTSGEWDWTPVADALETAGLWPIKKYIQRRHSTIEAPMACLPIYKLCMGNERIPGSCGFMQW